MTLTYILASVTLNSIAQIVWKKGANKLDSEGIIKMLLKKTIIIGLSIYAVSALLWITVLQTVEVSYAYPFISLGYVATTILSVIMLKEKVNTKRIIGTIIIIIGVIIVGASQ